MFEQRHDRLLAMIQSHIVEIVKYPGFAEFTQLSVHKAAAERCDDRRVVRLDRLGDAKCCVHRTWKGNREKDEAWRVARHSFQRQLTQSSVDQIERCR